ncbi:hypothetical protein BD410DRAFT_727057 [Rickenella mellea]|uniref:Snurportin-1 n=1 Tax=Rickenella mellea TaxID=50990 RepID=A0A4Y7PWX4_9AGAM|nr:hypothetical protein BD410DRAFT_727057 [Rickenella mellea]
MVKSSARRTSYKTPPPAVSDTSLSQQARRTQALEEQKRKRLLKIDASRQLDLFSELSLGISDDDDPGDGQGDKHGDIEGLDAEPEIVREGVGHFAKLLRRDGDGLGEGSSNAGLNADYLALGASQRTPPTSLERSKKKPKRKSKSKKPKQNKWADKCMYAELLEMTPDVPWTHPQGQPPLTDGLPDDLEIGWVALAPVPVGKRCLAVAQGVGGGSGIAPNTMLRSRLLGKALLPPFVSSLPPSTILDCILDVHWKDNGIVHVLDVLKWKGQDVGDCEAGFRFWWRDTRLSELHPFPPPQNYTSISVDSESLSSKYQFAHPTTFVPVPFYTPTTYETLVNDIIPCARTVRTVVVEVLDLGSAVNVVANDEDNMQLDGRPGHIYPSAMRSISKLDAPIQPDGLLLYVAQASYEPGTSPLSSWVPIMEYDAQHKDNIEAETAPISEVPVASGGDGPLAHFERYASSVYGRSSRLLFLLYCYPCLFLRVSFLFPICTVSFI